MVQISALDLHELNRVFAEVTDHLLPALLHSPNRCWGMQVDDTAHYLTVTLHLPPRLGHGSE